MMFRWLGVVIMSFVVYTVHGQYEGGKILPDNKLKKEYDQNDLIHRLSSSISAERLREHMYIIASDSFMGRDMGTPGIVLAENYIQKNLKNLGLQGAKNNSFLQKVEYTNVKWIDTDIFVNGNRFRLAWDYVIYPDKNENKEVIIDKQVVFAGYGIDDEAYNDYKKVDVTNKIVLIWNGEPVNKKGNFVLTGNKTPSDWSTNLDKKLEAAKKRGAVLVLILQDNLKEIAEKDRRSLTFGTTVLGDITAMPLKTANHALISNDIYKEILKNASKLHQKAEKSLAKGKPASYIIPTDIVVNMAIDKKVTQGNNVIGWIEGKDKKDEFVVISAHFDHVGKKGDEIFNGADDNGSGTVALLEIAKAFQQATFEASRPSRSVVFIWLTAEEKGLLGSSFYVKNPIFPLSKTVANINLDMIGRRDKLYQDSNEDYIYVIGSDRLSNSLHNSILDMNNKYSQLTLDFKYNDANDPNQFYYRSDHYNFAKNGIPSVFYFNGLHDDYHRTTDTAEKINYELLEKRTKHIFQVALDLANIKEITKK